MRPSIVLAAWLVSLLPLTAPALAQSSDAEAQQACGNDVFSLCQQFIPDRGRIGACLRANIRRVSPQCHRFMASYARAQRTAQRSHRRSRHHDYRHRVERPRHHFRAHRRLPAPCRTC